MNMRKIVAALFIGCVCGFIACSDDEEVGNPHKEVKILTSVNGNATTPQVRASIDPATGSGNLVDGDEITLSVWNENTSQGFDYTIGMTHMYWDELSALGDVPLNFLAFYPSVSVFELNQGFNAATATNPDLLSAYDTGVNEGETVNLVFNHIMHKLVVNLSSSDYTASQLASAVISLKNLKSTAGVSIVNGTVDVMYASGTDAYPAKTGASASFIVAPQNLSAAGTDLIEIAVEGKTFTYKIPSGLTVLESGRVLTLNLELKKDSGTVEDTGSNYNPGGGIPWN